MSGAAGAEAALRAADEGRWLATRFAPADVRDRLVGAHLLLVELARAPLAAREPALGDIRLAWWREAIGRAATATQAGEHPALEALQPTLAARPDLTAAFDAIAQARRRELDPEPFPDWSALEAHHHETGGLGLAICAALAGLDGLTPDDRAAPTPNETLAQLGAALGFLATARMLGPGLGCGRALAPGARTDAEAARAEALRRSILSWRAARRDAARTPASAFCAIGHAALVPLETRALARGRPLGPLAVRWAMLRAAAGFW